MELEIKDITNIEEYTDGNIEKTALASSAFVSGAASLCSYSKKLKEDDTNILDNLKKEIKENNHKENDLTTSLYNGFYSDDKRKVL